MHILPDLTHAVLHLLHVYGIWGLFWLLIVEEAGVPLPAPGDTLIALAGAQPERTLSYTVQVLGLCTLAVFIGSSALYWAMRFGGRSFLNRYGRYLRLNPQRLERMEVWLTRRGTLAIIVGRLIPGLRVPTTVMCGLTGVPYRVYGPSAALAGLIWSGLYFLLGAILRRRMGIVTSYVIGLLDTIGDSTLLTVFAIALVIGGALGAWHLFRRLRARRPDRDDAQQDAPEVAADSPTRQ